MNIAINAVFYHEKARGVGRVSNNILTKISEIDDNNEYYIFYGSWQKYDFLKIKKKNFHFIELNIKRDSIRRNFYLAFILPLKVLKYKPDIYHILDTSPIIYKTCKTISTIHDLAEYTVPEKYSPFKCFFRKIYVKAQIKKSDQLITVSEFTKKDIIKKFNIKPDKIDVIYNFFESNIKFDVNRKYENYFLIVGEIERTKNIELVLEAFSNLPNNIKNTFKIYIVGRKGNDYENVIKRVEEYKLIRNVKFFDYLSDNELFDLYKNAYALVFASLFEGFGLPVLEAMTFGVPVLTSNVTAMPEVAGTAELLFSPFSEKDLCELMKYIIENPSIRTDMIKKGFEQIKKFNSDDIVSKLLCLYRKVEVRGK